MQKTLVKYGSQSMDVIRHCGPEMRVTTVNAKCSWHRTLVEGKEVSQARLVLALTVFGSVHLHLACFQ